MAQRILRGTSGGAVLIFQEFAVEPAAVAASWQQFQYVTEKFGFDTGRLISRFPSHWMREVWEIVRDCDGIGAIQKKRIEEKLAKFKNTKLIKSRRNYDGGGTWLERAETQHQLAAFHAVIACANPRKRDYVACVDELDEEKPPLSTILQDDNPKVMRTADALAASLTLLLENSREILFVDRFFNPAYDRWRNPLKHFLQVATSYSRKLRRCEYHLEDSDDRPNSDFFHTQCKQLIPRCIPVGMSMRIIRWKGIPDGLDLHPRFILTEVGGVHIDSGLDERRGADTIITPLNQNLWRTCWNEYQKGTSPFTFVDSVTITGSAKEPHST